jgi:hypothetical protein
LFLANGLYFHFIVIVGHFLGFLHQFLVVVVGVLVLIQLDVIF